MSITFRCEHCGKDVKAPDSAGGKRGKCPHCRQSNYIPAPVSDDEVLDLAPEDEDYERHRSEEIQALRRRERDLLAENADVESAPPLEQRENLAGEDLHHFVVNYCLDMAASNLERAATHVERLRSFGPVGRQAVEDFRKGKAAEPALKAIPKALIDGFLIQLADKLA